MIVVADTSVLLNLCRVGQVELLQLLFHEVVIPLEVGAEFTRLSLQVPRFTGLTLPSWLRQQAVSGVPPSVRTAAGLDPGEIAALALALEIHADAILVDERRGHEVARQLGLRTIGVLGILLKARTSGMISSNRHRPGSTPARCGILDRPGIAGTCASTRWRKTMRWPLGSPLR